MANGQHGGYRRPEKPAPVSGPGKYSRRTDGGPGMTNTQAARYLAGQDYGEGKVANEVAQAAPLAAAPEIPPLTPVPEGFADLSAESQYPDEPETAGWDYGDGPGYTPMNFQFDDDGEEEAFDPIADVIRAAYRQNPTSELAYLVDRLNAEGR